MYSTLALLSALAVLTQGSPISTSKTCKEYSITVEASSHNIKWVADPIENNDQMAEVNTEFGRRDSKNVWHPLAPAGELETAEYTISGTFCTPTSGQRDTLIIATHGLGYERAYEEPMQALAATNKLSVIGILPLSPRSTASLIMLLPKATLSSTTIG
jgi:hypothetical protein